MLEIGISIQTKLAIKSQIYPLNFVLAFSIYLFKIKRNLNFKIESFIIISDSFITFTCM